MGENDVRTFRVYLQQSSWKVTWNYTWNLTLRRWIKIFREIIYLSVVVCSFIDNISSKHDPETTSQVIFKCFSRYTYHFCEDIGDFFSRFSFWALFDTQLIKIVELSSYIDFEKLTTDCPLGASGDGYNTKTLLQFDRRFNSPFISCYFRIFLVLIDFLDCQIDVQLLVWIGLSHCSLYLLRLFEWLWLISYHTNYVASCIVPFSSGDGQAPPADNTTKILISVLGSFFGVVICTLLVVYRIFFQQGKNVLLFCALCVL